jgi:hypothetical protein
MQVETMSLIHDDDDDDDDDNDLGPSNQAYRVKENGERMVLYYITNN